MARTAIKGWNMATIFDDDLRPVIFNKPIEEVRRELYHTSYVYILENTQNGKVYIGYHTDNDDVYYSSATDPDFKDVLASNIKGILNYTIVFWGSKKEAIGYEGKLLSEFPNIKTNPACYNRQYGQKGVNPLDIQKVKQLQLEIDDIREFRNSFNKQLLIDDSYSIEEIDLSTLHDFDKLQTRELEIDSDNYDYVTSMVRNRVIRRHGNGVEQYDMPVLLKDVWIKDTKTKQLLFHDYILISGNHTRTVYYDLAKDRKNLHINLNTKLKCLIIESDITDELQESEIYMLSNNLNRVNGGGKKFSKGDAVLECKKLHIEGFTYRTPHMKQRYLEMGLTDGQIKGVFSKMDDYIEKKKFEDSGWIVPDYTSDEGKDKIEERVRGFQQNDSVFVKAMSSGNPSLYRLIDEFMNEQEFRIANKKKVQDKIQIVLYHPTFEAEKNWNDKLKLQYLRPLNTSNSIELDNGYRYFFSKEEFEQLDNLFKMPPVFVDILPTKIPNTKQKKVVNNKQLASCLIY